jgi:hypothetical protein
MNMNRVNDSWANNSMSSVEDNGRLYRLEAFSMIREYLDWAAKHRNLAPKD